MPQLRSVQEIWERDDILSGWHFSSQRSLLAPLSTLPPLPPPFFQMHALTVVFTVRPTYFEFMCLLLIVLIAFRALEHRICQNYCRNRWRQYHDKSWRCLRSPDRHRSQGGRCLLQLRVSFCSPKLFCGFLIFLKVTQGNHTAIQSVFAAPCMRAHDFNETLNGFDSGFRDAGNFQAITNLQVPIQDNTTTIWYFDWNTCGLGGVGGINVNESSLETYDGFVVSINFDFNTRGD